MYRYVLKPYGRKSCSIENRRHIWFAFTKHLKAIKKVYLEKTGQPLVVGRTFIAPRSIVILVADGTSINVLSEILSTTFHNEKIHCLIPWVG